MKHTLARPLSLVVAAFVAIATAFMWSSSGSTTAQATTAALVPNPLVTVAHNYQGKATSKIAGTTKDGRQVTGSYLPLKFGYGDGRLRMRGLINGVVHNANGTTSTFSVVTARPIQTINGVPATTTGLTAALATCDILRLVLGPLDLDLLGLQVHLDRIVLNIIAAAGAGNLLGNLLCAVAGLLDGGLSGLLGRISGLLNQILGLLRIVG